MFSPVEGWRRLPTSIKGLPNSQSMEVLSMAVHTSPNILKQRVGVSRTYVRPVQRDLDLTPIDDVTETVSASIPY